MGILNRNCCCFIVCCLLPAGILLAQPQKLYLNPATAGAATQSKFIEITKFIPVNAPSEKINTYASLYITARYLIIHDHFEKKLQVLTKEGALVKTLDLQKYSDANLLYNERDETLRFNVMNKNYTLLQKDLVKIRKNYAEKVNQKYYRNYRIDLKDDHLEIKRTATDPYFIMNARWFYDDYYYLADMSVDPKAKDTAGYELQVLENYKPVQSFFPFNKTNDRRFRYPPLNYGYNIYLYNTDTPYVKYTSRPFNTTIYRLNKDSIEPVYEIVLPLENAIPAKFFQTGFKSKAEWDNFQNSNGAAFFSINDIKNLSQYLFFSIRSMRNYESYLYDKHAAKFYKTKMIKADSSQYNIQLLQNGPGRLYNGRYYAIIPANTLVDFYTRNKEKDITWPSELEAYLKTATKNANPIIVEYKIKD